MRRVLSGVLSAKCNMPGVADGLVMLHRPLTVTRGCCVEPITPGRPTVEEGEH